MRSDHQTRSLHYFHTYGVANRVDFSNVSDEPKCPDVNSINLQDLLPDENDDIELLSNFTALSLRILKKYVPFFGKVCKNICHHIPHKFSAQMSQKSTVVSYNVTPNYVSSINANLFRFHLESYSNLNRKWMKWFQF